MTTIKPIEPPVLDKVFQHDCESIVFVFADDGRVMCHGCKLLVPELVVVRVANSSVLDAMSGDGLPVLTDADIDS